MTTMLTMPRGTRGNFARTLSAGVAASAIALGLLMTTSAFAYDVNRADLREISFTTQSVYNQWINVSSSNGARWDTIDPGNVSFGAHVNINTVHHVLWHGLVVDVGIILGPCGEASCAGKPLLWNAHPLTNDYENQMEVTFPTSKIPVSSGTGIASVHHGDEIIAQCNQGPKGQERTFPYLMQATFAADTIQTGSATQNTSGGGGHATPAQWVNNADYSMTRMFQVQVRCKPFEPTTGRTEPREPHRQPPNDPHRDKVTAQDIDVFLTTYAIPAGSQTGPNGTTCKPLKVTTRIGTDKAGAVNVKLWRQVNGGAITSESKAMHAEALGGGKFGDDWNKFEQFNQTTTVQYKAEILGGTFAPSTQWKSITIHCNGDYAPPTNGDPNDPPRKPKGEVNLPPTIVTPPPACGTRGAKLRGSAPCIKTAPLPDTFPDKRKQWAEEKRKQAAEEKRRSAKDAELRRREVALKTAEMERRQEMHRPLGFGRFGGFGRFEGPGRPMRGFVMQPRLILGR